MEREKGSAQALSFCASAEYAGGASFWRHVLAL
jgi:hypothetical protein